jgi:septal ring factor EnvC (AmiA/AmiB activator)
LEEKCRRLESEKGELVEINLKVQKELEDQILEISDKRVSLAQLYAEQEENLLGVQKSLAEYQEIEEKLKQENAILKSKLYNITFRTNENDTNISQTTPQASSSFQKSSDPFPPEMDEIKLTAEQRSITDIFKTSFPS